MTEDRLEEYNLLFLDISGDISETKYLCRFSGALAKRGGGSGLSENRMLE